MNKYKLKIPFIALAPMANITTYPFASQCVKYGADIVWTPMVHTDTIINNWPEAKKILDFKDIDNYIIQIVGKEPDKFKKAIGIILKELKPLGFDLNFACPDKNILKSGCGGALMKDMDRISDIVKAAKTATKFPISVKTRAGWDNYEDIFLLTDRLEKIGIDMLNIHPRTVRQGFGNKANWEIVEKLVRKHPDLLICGSGDVLDWKDALRKQKDTGCSGVMIGRAALGNPWIFREIGEKKDYTPEKNVIKKLVLDLSIKAEKIWGQKGITESKKHFGWYFKGFPGAADYRGKLMKAETISDIKNVLGK